MDNQYFMLDTNSVSYILQGKPNIREKLASVPMAKICISSITEAELLRGLAKKPEAKRLAVAVKEFLLRVEVLPWDSGSANSYAQLRTACEKEGKSLGCMDMLIAAHSVATNSILITSDKAFYEVGHHLLLEDWMTPLE